nr:ribosomal protein S14 [Lithodesmioides sp. mgcode 4]
MKKLLKKDNQRRIKFLKFEKKYKILKSLTKNNNFTKNIRWNACLNLTELPNRVNKNNFTNRCVITSRKSIFKQLYSVSRLVFLRLAKNKKIYGLKKNIW